jgi:hypothetical protein
MSETVRRRELADVLTAALHEEAGAERYRRSQIQARRGRTNAFHRARPLEFDENGFPIAQLNPGFAARLARLLTPE